MENGKKGQTIGALRAEESGLVSTAGWDGDYAAWGIARYTLRHDGRGLRLWYESDRRPNDLNIAGLFCSLELASLPAPAVVGSLSELETQLEARSGLHSVTGMLPPTLGLIREGLELGPPLAVARIAARSLSMLGVAEALAAALEAAGEDPVALAEVRHVAQAAAPLVDGGLDALIVRADSFGFSPPHAEWLVQGQPEYLEILEAWTRVSKEEPAVRDQDAWREECLRMEGRVPRARIVDRLVRLFLRQLRTLIAAGLSKPVAGLSPPSSGWEVAAARVADWRPDTPPSLWEDRLLEVLGSSDFPLVRLRQMLRSLLPHLQAGYAQPSSPTPIGERGMAALIRALARGTSLRDERQEQIAAGLRVGNPFDWDEDGLDGAQLPAPPPAKEDPSAQIETEREARWTFLSFLFYLLVGAVTLGVMMAQGRCGPPPSASGRVQPE